MFAVLVRRPSAGSRRSRPVDPRLSLEIAPAASTASRPRPASPVAVNTDRHSETPTDTDSAQHAPAADNATVDPLVRSLASARAEPVAQATVNIAPDMPVLLRRLVRRIAWGGNGRKGGARIEIGCGVLSGATVMVDVDGGDVNVAIELPPGMDDHAWRSALESRFAARGLSVASLEVR